MQRVRERVTNAPSRLFDRHPHAIAIHVKRLIFLRAAAEYLEAPTVIATLHIGFFAHHSSNLSASKVSPRLLSRGTTKVAMVTGPRISNHTSSMWAPWSRMTKVQPAGNVFIG